MGNWRCDGLRSSLADPCKRFYSLAPESKNASQRQQQRLRALEGRLEDALESRLLAWEAAATKPGDAQRTPETEPVALHLRSLVASPFRADERLLAELRQEVASEVSAEVRLLRTQMDEVHRRSASTFSETLEARVAGLADAVEELRTQLDAPPKQHEDSACSPMSPTRPGDSEADPAPAQAVSSPSGVGAKVEVLQDFTAELRALVEERLLISLAELEQQVPQLCRQQELQAADTADRAGKLQEFEVRMEMVSRRLGTQEERLQSCFDRMERLPQLPQLRKLCREEAQKRLGEELPGLSGELSRQQEVLEEVQLQLQRLGGRWLSAGPEPCAGQRPLMPKLAFQGFEKKGVVHMPRLNMANQMTFPGGVTAKSPDWPPWSSVAALLFGSSPRGRRSADGLRQFPREPEADRLGAPSGKKAAALLSLRWGVNGNLRQLDMIAVVIREATMVVAGEIRTRLVEYGKFKIVIMDAPCDENSHMYVRELKQLG
ncbi:unnamed protein product, partial [Symbiodinium necroappetens]